MNLTTKYKLQRVGLLLAAACCCSLLGARAQRRGLPCPVCGTGIGIGNTCGTRSNPKHTASPADSETRKKCEKCEKCEKTEKTEKTENPEKLENAFRRQMLYNAATAYGLQGDLAEQVFGSPLFHGEAGDNP